MKLTSIDLELNQPSGKIVQIGAIVGDTVTGEITQRLRIYVNPYEPISEYITTLCGITQEHIDTHGVSLPSAYTELQKWHRKHTDFINPITWGGGDSQEIQTQLGTDIPSSWCFGRRWIDVKTLHVSRMIATTKKVTSGGLSDAMKTYNLKFQGREHDALDDAENTFRLYYEMICLIKHRSF